MSSSISPLCDQMRWGFIMSDFYEMEGYEGSKTWPENAQFLKGFFKFNQKKKWRYSEKKFNWDLEPNEIVLLERSVNALSNDCTGPVRKPIAGLPRLGPFYHICCWFPVEHGDHRFLYDEDSVHKYKELIVKMMDGLFPGYKIGYYFRIAYQACFGNYPEMHVHIVLSRIRYRMDDKEELRTFTSTRAHQSIRYHIAPIMFSTGRMKELLEPIWRTVVEEGTGRRVTSETPLVQVTGKDGQTIFDRYKVLRYVANQHLHTFENVELLSATNGGKVSIQFMSRNGSAPKKLILPQREFVLTYIINPMRTFGIQFRGRGFLCSKAAFAKVGDAAARLVLDEPYEAGEPRQFFYDLPVKDMRKRAAKVRQYLETGNAKALRRIDSQYKLGNPLEDIKILKELELKQRAEERAKRKLTSEKWDG